jgi:hypothetical protein
MVVSKDPDGALRVPTAAERQALSDAAANTFSTSIVTAPSAPVDLGAGKGTMLTLNPEESSVFSVVTKGPDGKLKMTEVTGKKAATAIVTAGQAAPAKKETVSDK